MLEDRLLGRIPSELLYNDLALMRSRREEVEREIARLTDAIAQGGLLEL